MIKISVAATAAEPVSVPDILEHGRIDTTAEDAYIGALISVARTNAENKTHRLLRPGTVTLTMDHFQAVELLPSPLRDSSSLAIQYVNSTGGVSLLGTSVYEIHDDSDCRPALLTTAYGQTWPTPLQVKGAVTISYLAGYTTSNPVPEPIKQWINLTVTGMYENRTSIQDANTYQALGYQFLDGLLEPYCIHVVK
jgi:uncharacterized phiE125 gp8 family phage protein